MRNFLSKELDSFLEYKRKVEGFSEKSYNTYKLNLKEAFEYMGIEKEGDTIRVDISAYRSKIVKKSKKTIAKKISIVRSFIEFLKNNSYSIKLIGDDMIKVPKTLPKPIEFSYIKEAVKSADNFEKTIILLLYGLGLRISELSNLKIDDIQDDWLRVVGKGDKMRNIPIPSTIKTVLKEYMASHSCKKYLFEKEGRRVSESSLRYRVNKAFKKIGIKATPHQLRHSYASDLLNRGSRINDVSILLGHKHLSTTQIYTELDGKYKLKNYKKAHPLCSL